MCCHPYPTRVVSAWDHGASPRVGGRFLVRSGYDGSHQGGRARGSCGRVNRGESRLHVVTHDQPTVRSGWGQQARGQDQARLTHLAQMVPHRRRGETSPTQARTGTVVRPSSSHPEPSFRMGQRPARGAEGAAGRGSWRKRRLLGHGAERDCARERPLTRAIILRARVQTSAWSVCTSACADEAETGVRGEGSRLRCWREPASPVALAPEHLATSPPARASCADPSRAGRTGGEAAQGPRLATHAHPLVERPCHGRHARDA
jgi:hypothetical protein